MLCRWYLLPLAIAHLVAQTVPERASVEGQVVNQRTGAPVAGAQIRLLGPDGSRTQAATDRKGRFIFSGLEAGHYRVQAVRAGFVPLEPWATTILNLAAGDQMKDFTVRLTPQAAISGMLLDADGAPLAYVYVNILRYTWRGGKRALTSLGGAQTNDVGEFRIAALAAGDYFLRAEPHELAVPPGEDKIKRFYVNTWFPGVTEAGAAAPLHLAAGDERAGLAFTLRMSTVVKVRGRVMRPRAKSEANAVVNLFSADDSGDTDIVGAAGANGPEGAFVIPGVPAGSYRIQAQLIDPAATRQDIFSASQIIQVGDSDVEGITLSPAPPQVLTGLVTWEGKPPKDTGRCFVGLGGGPSAVMNNLPPATVKADGAFSLELAPGSFELSARCEAKGSYMKAARMGDADILDVGIDGAAPPAGPLQVTMATGAAEIEGTVLDADSHPVGGATVVAIPDASKRAALFLRDITDQNGHFKLSDIVPGAYSLYAWGEVENEAWRNDEFIKKFDDWRKRVQLDVGGRQALQLQLIEVE